MRLVLSALVALAPLPASGWECRFAQECRDADPCAPTDTALTVETDGMAARLVTPSRTIEGRLGVTGGGASFVVAVAPGGVHLLTIAPPDGTARYTLHRAPPGRAITRLGTCTAE